MMVQLILYSPNYSNLLINNSNNDDYNNNTFKFH